jgi:3-deoxy-manno-octulosonate cytidylyltransferase (CMP-KDO synthetase)
MTKSFLTVEKLFAASKNMNRSDRIAEAVENLDVDIVINVQGDEPFIAEPLAKVIEVLE